METRDYIYDFILENGIATEEELDLVTCINGYNEEALNSIIFARTGYHDPEQCLDCEPETYEISEELKHYYGIEEDTTEDAKDLLSELFPGVEEEVISYFVENHWDNEITDKDNVEEFKLFLNEENVNWWDKN